ncbi:type III secretion system export apparatus subunit SctV [Dokdonella ginsengisoli]|uniref:Type III secretion system export apparatus subunit SctV n=1 Tax=Dokdonella ginsengisoli TaxID=363846 RepID=A0ABV9QZK4_9GAMM
MNAVASLFKFGSGSRSYSDIVLVFGVIAIVALMILPLPMAVIDTLVAINILIGVGLLLIAIYIPTPTAFSSFPSVLMLTTLFRLALSIAITRSILQRADAGHIIDTFGNFVVSGNLVIGLVIFLIITVVQFIVVAKGAERVAEVAARFSLDAMPGKQLSIDSDLRSGILDKDEAKRKRRLLEVESQLHGSLDGAMKFVKGDAIAGIVIIIINLLGGLAVGMLQHGMSLGDAVHTYSILTIGDGLVSQIPALLASMSAGLIVTRTASDGEDKHLGAAIAGQISNEPRVILVTGLIALLLMSVPGFPVFVFLLLGIVFVGIGAWRFRHSVGFLRKLFRVSDSKELLPLDVVASDELSAPPALLLEMDMQTLQQLGPANVRNVLRETVGTLREEYGVPMPAPALRAGQNLPANAYRVFVHGVRVGNGRLHPGARFLPAPRVGSRAALPAPAGGDLEAQVYLPAFPGEWRETAEGASGEGAIGALEVLRRHLRDAFEQHLNLFVGIQETSNLFNGLSRDYPDLVREMLRVVSPQRVADILKRLVEERIPVRHLRDVFEAVTDAASREKDIVLVAEYVRVALRRHISDRYAGASRTLHVMVAHPELEDRLRRSVHVSGGSAQLAVEPQLAESLLQQVHSRVRASAEGNIVLLCSMDVRRHLRKLTEIEFPALPVLSYQELVPDVKLVPLGQLTAA